MPVDVADLPRFPSLIRIRYGGRERTALLEDGQLYELDEGLDTLLQAPAAELEGHLSQRGERLDPADCQLLAPVESQEVWAAGVTYRRSREARMEESVEADVYARVYVASRPELFFKAAGWRVVAPGDLVGIRPDSSWNVPEPELCVLSNSRGEVVAYTCGNDMTSRSIEGENPLYLPQAKVYHRSCALGPAAVMARFVDETGARIEMQIERNGQVVFSHGAGLTDLVRDPAELTAVLHSAYPLPFGAWLMTGAAIVPPTTYTAHPGDVVTIRITGLGTLINPLVIIDHSGAVAPPRQHAG